MGEKARGNRARSPALRIGVLLLGLSLGVTPVLAQVLPGATVEERAITGAKEYIKKNNLKNPSLTMLMLSLFKNAMPTFAKQWEELTGVKMTLVESSSTDMPAKILAEAVAKTGAYDIFNQFPYVVPDAAGAGVLMPMDEYAAKGQPDFSDLAVPLQAQQSYNGKFYVFLLAGDHLMLVLRQDLLELPGVKEAFQARYGWEPRCPETMAQWEQLAAFFHTEKGQTRWGKTFDQELYGALGYRSLNFSHRHFPAYFGGLLFDKDMQPRINTPAESGKRDCSRPLLSEPDVKVSLHPAQASRRPCEGPVSTRSTCWLHDTRRWSIPLRGR